MEYSSVKLFHESAVLTSVTGFAIRGSASLMDAAWVRGRAARTVPHVVDTLLLASALTLLSMHDFQDLRDNWILAKLVGLLLYIGFGAIALRRGLLKPIRCLSFACALFVVSWMASVAISKSPWGYFPVRVESAGQPEVRTAAAQNRAAFHPEASTSNKLGQAWLPILRCTDITSEHRS